VASCCFASGQVKPDDAWRLVVEDPLDGLVDHLVVAGLVDVA
jgi:hypothetical protein